MVGMTRSEKLEPWYGENAKQVQRRTHILNGSLMGMGVRSFFCEAPCQSPLDAAASCSCRLLTCAPLMTSSVRRYAGAMSRAEAEDVLTDTPNGTFLIRDSDTRPGQYDLAISASMIPVPPTFWEARLPLFLGGRLPEPLTPPEVKHIKVLISYGKKKSKPLYAFAPNERRKWWSMQQLVDFFTTDSLERHFVGMSANLSTPYKHASPVRPKPLPSTSPYAEEDNTRTSVMFWALAVCVVAVAWVLVRTGWDGGTWEQCSPWVLAVTELPLVKAYGRSKPPPPPPPLLKP